MPVIGTAGHVDHGKSTLIQQITGRNPDRWAEERDRGLTIDLGFAWATLPDGTEVSFVDVPGHERFLKNMLAGIEAIDVALFVVAADEGWMPQSEEHLAVLNLLEVDRGVVAVTKSDAVEADLLELAVAEVAERLEGTSLEAKPIVTVSGTTGAGVSLLLDELTGQIPRNRPSGTRPRLWVDRSFAIPGAGTIVTGTLLDGPLEVDEAVVILPADRTARVRGIQSHEMARQFVDPGRRVALNLGGIGHDEVRRGDMVGRSKQWEMTNRFAVTLRTARFVDGLDQRGAFQLHIGSSSHRVEIGGLAEDVAIFTTQTRLPLTVGDRYILRDTGRQLVVAGGRVLDPAPGRTKRALAAARTVDPAADPNEIADHLLAIRHRDDLWRLSVHSRGGIPHEAIVIGDEAITAALLAGLIEKSIALVTAEHGRYPLRPGLPLATLAGRLRVSAAVAERVVDESVVMERRGPEVALVEHHALLTVEQEDGWQRAQKRLAESLAVPTESELELEADVLAHKIRTGELVRVSADLVFLPSQLAEVETSLRNMVGEFTVAEFRDAAGLSRKYAVPILEWSDREGLTVRRGDLRRFR